MAHLCDRVAVMREGRIVAIIERAQLSEEAIVAAAMGSDFAEGGRMSLADAKRAYALYWPAQAQRNRGVLPLFALVTAMLAL